VTNMNDNLKTILLCLGTMYVVHHMRDLRRIITESF
jgi:hypothetical protein